MIIYTVEIDSYETDNSCATYHYSNGYVTFEEAQNALEEEFWEFEHSHGLTERDSRYNKNTNTFEEIPDSNYVYTFEVASDSFEISDSWSNYSGVIIEEEISNSLPNGHWYYIKKHGLPKEEGTYLVSSSKAPYAFTAYFNPETVCEEDYCEGFFDSAYMEYEIHSIYAWTEVIQPASR